MRTRKVRWKRCWRSWAKPGLPGGHSHHHCLHNRRQQLVNLDWDVHVPRHNYFSLLLHVTRKGCASYAVRSNSSLGLGTHVLDLASLYGILCKAGPDISGANRHDVYVRAHQLDAGRFSNGVHGELCGAIGGTEGQGNMPSDTRDVDYSAGSLLAHDRDDGLHGCDAPKQVGFKHLSTLGELHGGNGIAQSIAGVVDPDVQAPEVMKEQTKGTIDLLTISHVTGEGQSSFGIAHAQTGGFHPSRVSREQYDVGSMLGENFGDRFPDAHGRTSNGQNLSDLTHAPAFSRWPLLWQGVAYNRCWSSKSRRLVQVEGAPSLVSPRCGAVPGDTSASPRIRTAIQRTDIRVPGAEENIRHCARGGRRAGGRRLYCGDRGGHQNVS